MIAYLTSRELQFHGASMLELVGMGIAPHQMGGVLAKATSIGNRTDVERIAFSIPICPACDSWGMSRAMPVDRYHIDAFLSRYAADIRRHVREIGDCYSKRGKCVAKIDVLDLNDEILGQRLSLILQMHLAASVKHPNAQKHGVRARMAFCGLLHLSLPHFATRLPGGSHSRLNSSDGFSLDCLLKTTTLFRCLNLQVWQPARQANT
jgi:hypothetical protein